MADENAMHRPDGDRYGDDKDAVDENDPGTMPDKADDEAIDKEQIDPPRRVDKKKFDLIHVFHLRYISFSGQLDSNHSAGIK